MDAFLGLPDSGTKSRAMPSPRQLPISLTPHSGAPALGVRKERSMSDFEMQRRMLGQRALTRRRMLQATAGTGLTIGLAQNHLLRLVRAQEGTFSRDYE